ncbi:hypothetical protein BB561_005989 [Smittium simulii]|uniref:Uncharacterized protein n=1 Tax=Smittium simulii TaxID=133385 RepID=A0A2T9Y766_9FUNG|nr:hypothetical protein BB561_005989 [Smittium simulii]
MSTHYDPFAFDKFKQVFEENVQDLIENVQDNIWAVLIFYTADQDPKKTIILSDKPNPTHSSQKFNYTIGRSKTCDIRLNGVTISNRHCSIYKINTPEEEIIFIEDMSSNGTFVNSKRIPKNKPWRLNDEDTVRLSKNQTNIINSQHENIEFIVQIIKEKLKSEKSFSKNYILGKNLGKGAFAEVKLAFNRMSGNPYAVKIIDTSKINEHKRLLLNFDVEKSILGRVKHPSIIKIHAIYYESSYFYVILDLAKGGELFDRIVEQGHFTENETRIIMLQLLLAINYLHFQGIVHRDIKPENILLSEYEGYNVKLADFGLAKIVGETSFMKTLCGTPMYVAPEVIKSYGKKVYSNKVDMWSLGVVLYICLYGFPPFSDDLAPPSLNQQIVQGIFTFPEENTNIVSREAKEFVSSMLTVDPEQRISAKEALNNPWLRAYKEGSAWKIKGIDDFSFTEKNYFIEEDSTQSMSQSNQSYQSFGD